MAYQVSILPEALRTLTKLDEGVRRRVAAKIDQLAENPRPSGAKALQGDRKGYLRIRVGDWRVVYRVEDDKLLVLVVRIGHRGEVYR